MIEAVSLRSKCYSFKQEELDYLSSGNLKPKLSEKRVLKGISKHTSNAHLRFQHYKNCLFKDTTYFASYGAIKNNDFRIYTQDFIKSALCSFDSKRYIYSCSIHTEPYGSYLIKKYGPNCPYCPKEES